MNTVIYNPLQEFDSKYKELHCTNTTQFFDSLVKQSGIDIEGNRETVRLHNEYRENMGELKKKYNWARFWRVIMCITILLIPVVVKKTTPKIKQLKEDIDAVDQKADQLMEEAKQQMAPLNRLFTSRDAIGIIEKTIPMLSFDDCFTVKQETDMRINYDFKGHVDREQSALKVLAGRYNDNPFLFEKKLVHKMGMETYHGYKTIHWTETYRDSDGKMRTRSRSERLHATVTKPKPFYSNQVVLNYCAQGGPDLTFSRDATNLDEKSERAIERYIKRGERKLDKKNDRAIKDNDDFMSMSNTEFEVLFDALNRSNEVQFRTLFTPLAQTNMVDLLLSKTAYGDDFDFVKYHRTNRIISEHSQGRDLYLYPHEYTSYSYDIVRENFIGKNQEYFKAVYFDFAPAWAIPMYQDRPVHSLKPIPDYSQMYSLKECEALANSVDYSFVAHPKTKTKVIIKTEYVSSRNSIDTTCITAYSYDIKERVEVVSVYGGDGRYHNVSVPWDEYLPLEASKNFCVATEALATDKKVIGRHNGLCIFKA